MLAEFILQIHWITLPIQRVSLAKQLGVWLDDSLSFKEHLNITVARTVLGFICRMSADVRDPLCLKALNCC